MAHVFRDRYLTNVVSGTIGDADETAPSVSDASRVAVTTNALTQNHQWVPNTTATNTNTAPGAPSSASANGWRTVVGEYLAHCSDATVNTRDEAITIAAGTWPVRIRYLRDNQTLSGNASGTVTVIVYRVNAAGTSQEEIGRATSASLSFTTTAQTATVNVTGSSVSCAKSDRIQVDFYGVFSAYASVGTANCAIRVDTEANSGSKLDAPDFTISYAETDSDNQNPTDSRILSRTQAESDSTGSVDAVAKSRTQSESDNEPLIDSRVLSRQAARQDPENLTDTNAKTRQAGPVNSVGSTDSRGLSQSKTRSDSSNPTDSASKSRQQAETDNANPTDSRSLSRSLPRQDAEPLTDALTKTQNKVKSDPEDLTDSRNIGRGFQRTDLEALGSSIFVGPFEQIHVVGGGGEGPGGRTYKLEVSEGLTFTDTPATEGGHQQLDGSDSVGLTDATFIIFSDDHRTYVLDFQDTAGLADTASHGGGHQAVSGSDSLRLSDATVVSTQTNSTNTVYRIVLADYVGCSDTMAQPVSLRITTSDSVGLTDAGRVNRASVRVTDRLKLRDSAVVTLRPPGAVFSDRLKLRESVVIELIPPEGPDRSIGRYQRVAR